MKISNCKINHLKDPIGFHLPDTVFSWEYQDVDSDITRSRIRVWSDKEAVADTGFVTLDPLAAELKLNLKPRTRYHYQISARDLSGKITESAVCFFETGKMDEEWQGKWISCDNEEPRHPIFSRSFSLTEKVVSARLYICGLGLYEARINGEKVSEEYLTPLCTNYNRWVQAQTYDITPFLKSENRFSCELGNGWYKGRFGFRPEVKPYYGSEWKLIAEIRLVYESGTEEVIATDDSWSVTRSSVYFSNIYDGEYRDDTLPELTDTARYCAPPEGKLMDRLSLPVTVHEILKPRELIITPKDEKVFDFGQNMTGIFRLKVRGRKGMRVHIQTGEVMQQGCFYRDNLRTAKSEYIYVSDGKDTVIEPKFTFYGFRYVKVEGIDDITADDICAVVLHSEFEMRGRLVTGNDKINQLISNATWGMKSNFLDVPTDCPQRDERMGWTGDTEVFAPTAMYLADATAFYDKFEYDTYSEQLDNNGAVPFVVPSFGLKEAATAWGDVATILPDVLYRYEGDLSILKKNYPSMKAWVDYITSLENDGSRWQKQFHFGDWLALDSSDDRIGATDTAFIALAYYLKSIRLTRKAACLLDKQEDMEYLGTLETAVLKQIRDEFYTPNGRCAVDTQTAYLLSIDLGLAPDTERMQKDLIGKMNRDSYELKTGFIGTPLLLEGLSRSGRSDLAYDLLFNESYPGWLYCINLGATTIWERWNSMLEDGSVSSTGMNSFNHYAFGSVVSWIFERSAGFRQAPDSVGFRKVIIAPQLDHRLGHIDMEYHSASGLYKTGWKIIDNNTVRFHADIPYGCQAEVILPLYDEQDGCQVLKYGHHELTYHTTRPLRKTYSVENTINELFESARVRKIMLARMPQLSELPPSMYDIPLKHLIAYGGNTDSEQALKMLNALLSEL